MTTKEEYRGLVEQHKCTVCWHKLPKNYTKKKCQACSDKYREYNRNYHRKLPKEYYAKYYTPITKIKLKHLFIIEYFHSISQHDIDKIANCFDPSVWSDHGLEITQQVIADNIMLRRIE